MRAVSSYCQHSIGSGPDFQAFGRQGHIPRTGQELRVVSRRPAWREAERRLFRLSHHLIVEAGRGIQARLDEISFDGKTHLRRLLCMSSQAGPAHRSETLFGKTVRSVHTVSHVATSRRVRRRQDVHCLPYDRGMEVCCSVRPQRDTLCPGGTTCTRGVREVSSGHGACDRAGEDTVRREGICRLYAVS
jgi:hypothetical protein